MLIKLYIIQDDKLILNNFILEYIIEKQYINLYDSKKLNIVKIPVYNKYTGLLYINISLPIKFKIIDNNFIFNPYIILSSYNLDYDIDFFYNIKKNIYENYNLTFINILDNIDIINLYNDIDLLDNNIIKTIYILCNIKLYKYPNNNYYNLLDKL